MPLAPCQALCVLAITAWLPDQTDYQTVSNTNTPLEVVTIFEQRAQSELSACADLSLVDNGTVVSPNTDPIFGVGYTYTSITGAVMVRPGARLVDGVEAIAAVLQIISKAPVHLVRQVR